MNNIFGQGCNDNKGGCGCGCHNNQNNCNIKWGGTSSCKVLIYLAILYFALNCGIFNCGFDLCTIAILIMFYCCFCKKGMKFC